MNDSSIRLLLVEDNPGDARLVRALLRESASLDAELLHAARLDEAREIVRAAPVDVILLDLSLPDSVGLATVTRMLSAAPQVPVIVLTGLSDDELAAEALRAGAQDYLVKGSISSLALARGVRYALERKSRENEQRRTEAELSLLQRLTFALGQAEHLEAALHLVLQEVCRTTGWAGGESWLPDSTVAQLERGPAWWGTESLRTFEASGEPLSFARGDGLPGRVWRSAKPLWVPDVTEEPDLLRLHLDGEVGIRAALLVPVLTGDEVAAVLAFYHTEARVEDERLARLVAATAAPLGAIIQRRRAEQALRASEAHLRRLMDTAYDGIWILDAEARTEYANPRLTEILGYTSAEMLGRSVFEFQGEQMAAEAHRRLERRRRGESETGELPLLRKDGGEVWVHASASPIRDEHDRFRGSFVTLSDVTEQKRAEAAERLLAEAGEHFNASLDLEETLEEIGRLLVPRLADWCVVDVVDEEGMTKVVRIVAEDRRKQKILRRMLERYPHHAELETHPVGRVLQTGESMLLASLDAELLARVATDPEHADLLRALDPRSSVIVPLTAQGRVVGVMTLTVSESGRRFGAHELALAEELGRRAGLAIVNSRLYQSARRAVKTRDEVLGFVAHDLRNPLGAVAMTAELLLDTALADPQRRRHLRGIQRAVHQADHLIQDLLDATQLEAGRLRVELEPLAIQHVLSEAQEMAEAHVAEGGLTLRTAFVGSLPAVRADRTRLLQVLSNLIGNAIKFSPAGGTITLRAEPRGADVLISVSNTGPAIPPDQIPHLFDRFWQAQRGSGSGVGLGLAIVKGLVEAQGGRIWVESSRESGSTFSFTLPMVGEGMQEKPEGVGAGSAAGAEQAASLRVVLADDHTIFLRSLEALLQGDGGFEVLAAVTSGERAVEEALARRPDLVLVDLAMPGIGGIEAIRRINALGLPVRTIALTADPEGESLVDALEAGACGYIRKTVSPEAMIASIRAAAAGELQLDARGKRLLLERYREPRGGEAENPLTPLSEQERAMLALAAEGFTSVEIGKRLFLSPATVDTYRSRLMRRLELRNRAELVRFAVQTGLLSGPTM